MIYENENIYLLWKPRGLPSTFGPEKSLLDFFSDKDQLDKLLQNNTDFEYCLPYISLDWYTKVEDISIFLNNQLTQFSQEQEFGLLNRLDNDTGGFLYFAKTSEKASWYKDLQSRNQVQKTYLAEVVGNPFYSSPEISKTISTPIMHHSQSEDKMITIKSLWDNLKWRGKVHNVSTYIQLIHYNSEKNTSLIKVVITKWVRHQIRVHLSSSGSPIIGDILYNKKSNKEQQLQLWSISINFTNYMK